MGDRKKGLVPKLNLGSLSQLSPQQKKDPQHHGPESQRSGRPAASNQKPTSSAAGRFSLSHLNIEGGRGGGRGRGGDRMANLRSSSSGASTARNWAGPLASHAHKMGMRGGPEMPLMTPRGSSYRDALLTPRGGSQTPRGAQRPDPMHIQINAPRPTSASTHAQPSSSPLGQSFEKPTMLAVHPAVVSPTPAAAPPAHSEPPAMTSPVVLPASAAAAAAAAESPIAAAASPPGSPSPAASPAPQEEERGAAVAETVPAAPPAAVAAFSPPMISLRQQHERQQASLTEQSSRATHEQDHMEAQISTLEASISAQQGALLRNIAAVQELGHRRHRLAQQAEQLQAAVARAQAAAASRIAEVQELEALTAALQATLNINSNGRASEVPTAGVLGETRAAVVQLMKAAATALRMPTVALAIQREIEPAASPALPAAEFSVGSFAGEHSEAGSSSRSARTTDDGVLRLRNPEGSPLALKLSARHGIAAPEASTPGMPGGGGKEGGSPVLRSMPSPAAMARLRSIRSKIEAAEAIMTARLPE